MRASSVRRIRNGRPSLHKNRLYQHWDHSASVQAKRLVSKSLQDSADLTGVRSDRDVGMVVGAKDLVEDDLASQGLCLVSLARHAVPENVLLCETSFDIPGREQVMDVGPVAPAITRMRVDALAEELLHGWDEGVVVWYVNSRECQVCSPEAASERTRVV